MGSPYRVWKPENDYKNKERFSSKEVETVERESFTSTKEIEIQNIVSLANCSMATSLRTSLSTGHKASQFLSILFLWLEFYSFLPAIAAALRRKQ